MYNLGKYFFSTQHLFISNVNKINHKRFISALFVTGDKATDNYAPLEPFMDFKNMLEQKEMLNMLEHSIKHRNLSTSLPQIRELYEEYKKGTENINAINVKREGITKKLKESFKNNDSEEKLQQIKQEGKNLKNDLKMVRENFYELEDNFVHSFLSLPNFLHDKCPLGSSEEYIDTHKDKIREGKCHLQFKQFIEFIDNDRYYMKDEAAEFDIYCTYALTKHFLKSGKFTQTANPDFARAVLLQANATPMERFHKVIEKQLENKINAAYLTGGGAFESFLGAVTKLCIYPSKLPLKWVSGGRLYEKTLKKSITGRENLFSVTQTNAVQTFGASSTAKEADHLMESILNLCSDFYKSFNLHFRVVYVPASKLDISESLRAQLEFFSPSENRYICVGRVSNYKDFVSKRILFCMREGKDYHFVHVVGGPVLYTSRLLAILLEYDQSLKSLNEQLCTNLNYFHSSSGTDNKTN